MLKPKILQLEVTNDCNLNCSICMRKTSNREIGYLSPNDFEKLPLEKFKEVAFHGWGEPLLYPNVFEMINKASDEVETSIITNGLLLDKRLDELLRSNLDSIAFGVFTPKKKVFENIAEFCKVNKDIKTFIDITILPWNIEEIGEIVKFAGKHGINVVLHKLFHLHNGNLRSLSNKEIKLACKIAKDVAREYGIKVYTPPKQTRPCAVALSCIFVGYDLTASPCCFLHEMNYHYSELNFDEHMRFLKEMKKNDVCKRCPW